MSIRKEFENVLDMSQCQGIEFDFSVDVSSNARLRMTITDVVDSADINNHGADEMWWFDFRSGVLRDSKNWITLQVPFENFRSCYGEGCRVNDRKLDLSKIIAFEFNIVSNSKNLQRGTFLIRDVRTY